MDCSKDASTAEANDGEDIDKVETLIKSLYIEKQHRKQPRVGHHNRNPFKRKFTKKRKQSICYSVSQCKHILDKVVTGPSSSSSGGKKEKGSNVMLKITDKMAKLWSEDGYRETFPATLRALTAASDAKKDTSATTNNNLSSTASGSEETSENHQNQVSSQTCARQAMYDYCDSVTELAAYLDEALFIPRKMSFMAEMMYT